MTDAGEHLLERIAAGDEAGFMAFYDAYSPRVYGLLIKLLGSVRAESDDVLQEVFLEIWRKADKYDPALGTVTAWVLMVARRRAIDRLRKRGRDEALVGRTQPGHLDPAVDDSGLDEPVRTALEQLPDEQRSLIAMAFFGGLTREQIATASGLPVGTVKTRIRTGIGRLRELLEPAQASQT